MSICVVVADSSRARILVAESEHGPLVDERDYIHAESRLREQDLVSDGTGSESDSGGLGKHSMGHEKAAHQKEAETFAHELCDEIDKLRRTRDLRRIYLVASPKFLGLLRSGISKQCAELVAGEVNKDLVDHSIEDIRSHLPVKNAG
jgi:protein required for attachment to host cells